MKGNIDHPLRLFLEIANRGSLSAAAEALSLSQSGLSRQLAALERHVGQPLFVRHGRGVEPTDAGRRLLEAARPAYQAIDDAVMQLRERHGLTAGNLNVATVHTLGHDFVSEIVARFMRQRPDASVSLLERSSPGVAEMVEGGGAEIGFVYDAAVASDLLEITPLFDEEMGFVAHQSSRFASLAAITLDAHTPPLIVFPPSYALRRMLHGRAFHAKVAAEVELDGRDAEAGLADQRPVHPADADPVAPARRIRADANPDRRAGDAPAHRRGDAARAAAVGAGRAAAGDRARAGGRGLSEPG